METSANVLDAVFATAARAAHPVDGPMNVLASRIGALERRIEYLGRRLDALGVVVDLLSERADE